MISFDLQPTDENIVETFISDGIGRNEDVYAFIDILDTVDGPQTIALDGSWGSGKTFFVKQCKMILDACNPNNSNQKEEDKTTIETMWKDAHEHEEDRCLHSQVPVYYDAWVNDNSDDPITSLIYEIMVSVNGSFPIDEKDTGFMEAAASIAEVVSGRNINQLLQTIKGKDDLDKVKTSKEFHEQVKTFLDSIIAERGERLVVFIDELDRCKPSFAIELLERIKHYFDNENVTFVISVNIAELINTIKHYYGYGFNASKYLDRFFDLRFEIPPVDMGIYYRTIDFKQTSMYYDLVSHAVIDYYNFTMRETAHYLRLIKMAYNPNKDTSSSRFYETEESTVNFCSNRIIPIIIGLNIHDRQAYEDFVQGKDYTPIINILGKTPYLNRFFEPLLTSSETYEETDKYATHVEVQDKIKDFYEAIFVNIYTQNQYEKTIGKLLFNKNIKRRVLKIAGLFS